MQQLNLYFLKNLTIEPQLISSCPYALSNWIWNQAVKILPKVKIHLFTSGKRSLESGVSGSERRALENCQVQGDFQILGCNITELWRWTWAEELGKRHSWSLGEWRWETRKSQGQVETQLSSALSLLDASYTRLDQKNQAQIWEHSDKSAWCAFPRKPFLAMHSTNQINIF